VSNRLGGTTALVTGAGSGIGRAITERFVAEGARVAAIDLSGESVEALSVAAPDGAVLPLVADVTDEAALASAVGAASAALGPIDTVVANAGRGAFSPIVDHDAGEWRSILDLCLTGVFLTIKHGAPAMRDGGSIITIASLNAIQPSAGMAAYCAAKAGAVALTKVAAMELGPRGIRANAIAPGLVRTAASSAFWELPGVVEEFVENTTVGRFATPADVAGMAVYLASDESSFVSAAVLSIDGGASTKRYPDLPAALDRLVGGAG
jgi:NAD(P)-dependent dehydrogenase (short-subunit alcohol dehydrogenase family)